MAKNKQEPSTQAAGGTPWKARLRPHHATPLGSLSSPRIPSPSSRVRDEDEDARRFKTPGSRRHNEGDNGAVRRSLRVRARRSPRFACQDSERPVVLEVGVNLFSVAEMGSIWGTGMCLLPSSLLVL